MKGPAIATWSAPSWSDTRELEEDSVECRRHGDDLCPAEVLDMVRSLDRKPKQQRVIALYYPGYACTVILEAATITEFDAAHR